MKDPPYQWTPNFSRDSIFMDVLQLIRKLIRESIKDTKIYYHGREGSRPFDGNYIYLTDNPHYAMGYADGKVIKAYRLKVPSSSIFSIKDPAQLALLAKHVDPIVINSLLKGNRGHEMDWASISYIENEEHEEAEDLLMSLGFHGIFLYEREWAESIYVFDQNDVEFIKDINIDNPAMVAYRKKMYDKLVGKYNFL